jgi:acetyl-CoA synthetase
VSGHRLSTAEIEAALIEHHAVAEAAVVGVNDELTGQAVNAFVAIKDGNEINDQLRKDMVLQVRKSIGPFAAPKAIYIVPDLPKTRSGKIMRRILRKILAGEEDQLGDTSTVCSSLFPNLSPFRSHPYLIQTLTNETQLSDPSVVDKIIETVKESRKK